MRSDTTRSSPRFGGAFIEAAFEEVIVPALWEAETFTDKVGAENSAMMWRFADRGDRQVCLVPEITGLLQETWRDDWSKTTKTRNVFYAARCYRYERPQRGRYREFTQFGIEMLGQTDTARAQDLLKLCLDRLGLAYVWDGSATRGLSYYVEDGFEASVTTLGAQKQVAGGGRYAEGVGWAIGVDRVMLC